MSDPGIVGKMASESAPGVHTSSTPATQRWAWAKVVSVRRWTGNLLSFSISRPPEFRFTPGHYARLGLGEDADAIEWRPFSIVSAPAEDVLEFFAVLVPAGAFSNRLARVRVGDAIRIEKAAYGFLTVNQLASGKHLWLLASGTGLGPFVSILRDKTSWRAFDRIVVVHSVRYPAELAYRDEIEQMDNAAGDANLRAKLHYLPVVTREPYSGALSARIPQLIEEGQLERALGMELTREHSRVMVCGNPEMVKALRALLSAKGFQVNRRGVPGQMAFEKYW